MLKNILSIGIMLGVSPYFLKGEGIGIQLHHYYFLHVSHIIYVAFVSSLWNHFLMLSSKLFFLSPQTNQCLVLTADQLCILRLCDWLVNMMGSQDQFTPSYVPDNYWRPYAYNNRLIITRPHSSYAWIWCTSGATGLWAILGLGIGARNKVHGYN